MPNFQYLIWKIDYEPSQCLWAVIKIFITIQLHQQVLPCDLYFCREKYAEMNLKQQLLIENLNYFK